MAKIKTIGAGHTHVDGLCIGAATTDKLAFNGATPVVQPVGATQAAYVTTSVQEATVNASAPSAGYVQAEAVTTANLANAMKIKYNALQTDYVALSALVHKIRTDLVALALIKGAA